MTIQALLHLFSNSWNEVTIKKSAAPCKLPSFVMELPSLSIRKCKVHTLRGICTGKALYITMLPVFRILIKHQCALNDH